MADSNASWLFPLRRESCRCLLRPSRYSETRRTFVFFFFSFLTSLLQKLNAKAPAQDENQPAAVAQPAVKSPPMEQPHREQQQPVAAKAPRVRRERPAAPAAAPQAVEEKSAPPELEDKRVIKQLDLSAFLPVTVHAFLRLSLFILSFLTLFSCRTARAATQRSISRPCPTLRSSTR